MTEFLFYLNSDEGASAAEYALILAIVGGGIVFAAMALGGAVGTSMNEAAQCMTTNGATCP